jgi:hypothetical protein
LSVLPPMATGGLGLFQIGWAAGLVLTTRFAVSWLLTMALYISMSAFSAYLATVGLAGCGCFGTFRVHPVISIGLGIVAAACCFQSLRCRLTHPARSSHVAR